MDTSDLRLHSVGIRADIALRAGRYADALGWLDVACDILHALPGVVPSDAMCWRVWALTALRRTDEAAAALDEARRMPDLDRWYGRPVVLAGGVALLEGDADGLDRVLDSAPASMPMDLALMRLIGAEVIDGPPRVQWLREALDAWEAMGASLPADRARRLLREAGGPVPRRRRQQAAVPEELAAAGVTAREAEVLRLVGEGLPNAEIAQRLYVSVRTVEAHVSSLLAKLHARSRAHLATVAARSFA